MRVILASLDSLATLHGGVEAYVHQLALALQEEGHDVRVVARSPRSGHAAPPGVAYEFVRLPALPSSHRTRLLLAPTFARGLRKRAAWADVVHGQNADGIGALGVRPVVATAHTTPVDEWASSRLGGWREALYQRRVHERELRKWRALAAGAARWWAVGEHVAQSVRSLGAASRVEVVSNPVAPMRLVSQAEARHKLALPNGPLVLYLGRLARVKRVDRLLDAMRQLPDARAVIAGEGPEAATLRARAPQNVAFRGRVGDDEKALLYSAADALALPSEHEGQPLVLLEALSAGLPIVATRAEWVPPEHRARGLWGDDLVPLLREALKRGRGAPAPVATYRDLARTFARGYEEVARR